MKTTDISKIKRFLEDFSWLMDTYSDVDLKEIKNMVNASMTGAPVAFSAVGNYQSRNSNKHYLTGVLPALFLDQTLFRTNDEIAQFAKEALRVDILRYHKKSKYELIGHIVCETNKLDEKGLDQLVRALGSIVESDERRSLLKKRKKREGTFNWNEAIQDFSKM